MGEVYSRLWLVAGLVGAVSIGTGCAARQAPPAAGPDLERVRAQAPAPPEAAQAGVPEQAKRDDPKDGVPDRLVAEAAEGRGLDPEDVVDKKRESERRVEALDQDTEREFLALFGPDPLGLAREPENAGRYEIPLEMNSKVEAWIDYFQDVIPERFSLYLRRLGRYGPMIRQKLASAGLPQELTYLALIESGMNPNAYSRARASGMWQFIASTGRLYDLHVDYWVDERRDPVKATDAAIRHLADLYDEFGSWYLAAAAYNGGAGRVHRAVARTGSDDFWVLANRRTLRRETRSYVPKLIAAAIIAKDPERYGFGGVQPDPPLEFDEVEVADATSFDVLAKAAGTDEETIRELNPYFRRHVTPPGRKVEVRVPVGTGARFAANYAKIPPSERVTWLEHVVTRGETLGQIARRYGTSVAAIRASNRNVSPRRLQIGQRLIVPRAETVVARANASAGRNVRRLRPSGPTTVTVRRGDTLWSIARRYAVSTRELMTWNKLRSAVIHPGDRLTVGR